MLIIKMAFLTAIFVVTIQGFIVFVSKTLIEKFVQHRFDVALSSKTHQFQKALEDYKLGLKIREQASAIAEYSVLAQSLRDNSNQEKFDKANQMARQLFPWLPTDIYRSLGLGIAYPHLDELPKAFIGVRSILLGEDAGNLNKNDWTSHAPGIGRPQV